MQIAQGASGDVSYDLSFVGGKLVGKVGDAKLGIVSDLSIDGALVADAIVDLIEKAVPGDQLGIAAIVKGLIEQALKSQV